MLGEDVSTQRLTCCRVGTQGESPYNHPLLKGRRLRHFDPTSIFALRSDSCILIDCHVPVSAMIIVIETAGQYIA